MLGRTHDLAAFTTLTVAAVTLPVEPVSLGTAFASLLAAMVGGLVPDLDEPSADIWDTIPVGEVVSKILSPFFGKHRNVSHSILGVVLAYFVSRYLLGWARPYLKVNLEIVWVSFMLGFISHLVTDSFTQEGIPLFLPFKAKVGFPPIKALRIKTGAWIEKSLVFPGLLALNFYLFWQHYQRFVELIVR